MAKRFHCESMWTCIHQLIHHQPKSSICGTTKSTTQKAVLRKIDTHLVLSTICLRFSDTNVWQLSKSVKMAKKHTAHFEQLLQCVYYADATLLYSNMASEIRFFVRSNRLSSSQSVLTGKENLLDRSAWCWINSDRWHDGVSMHASVLLLSPTYWSAQ